MTLHTTERKKKRGFMHSLYSVFFGSSHADTVAQKPASTSISMFLSSIRPLHIANDGCQSPPPPPPLPQRALSMATSKSSYASADFGDKVFEVDDEMRIEEEEDDVVEEMSIGKVYQQIRLQALNSIGVVRGSN